MLHLLSMALLFLALFFLPPSDRIAQSTRPTDHGPIAENSYANLIAMNGIGFFDYFEFWKSWRLVTTRYREDTGELRFTYANQLAWDTLSKNRTDYANGAVFAKIGYETSRDASFASSLVPNAGKRVQFMVRNGEKYAQTDGWGYALFNEEGKTFAGEPKQAALACAACHRIVKTRGFVFSEPLDVTFTPQASKSTTKKIVGAFAFEEFPGKNLPAVLKKFLPAEQAMVSSLKGDFRRFAIAGTLDEVRPTLIIEAKTKHRPAVLVHEFGKIFSAIWPEAGADCDKGKASFAGLISYPTSAKQGDRALLKFDHFCN